MVGCSSFTSQLNKLSFQEKRKKEKKDNLTSQTQVIEVFTMPIYTFPNTYTRAIHHFLVTGRRRAFWCSRFFIHRCRKWRSESLVFRLYHHRQATAGSELSSFNVTLFTITKKFLQRKILSLSSRVEDWRVPKCVQTWFVCPTTPSPFVNLTSQQNRTRIDFDYPNF